MGAPKSDPDTVPKVPLRRILGLLRPYRSRLGVMLALVAASSMLAMVPPFLLRTVLDVALPHGRAGLLSALAAGMLAVVLVSNGVGVGQAYLSLAVGERMMNDLRIAVYARLQRMPLAFFTRTRTGEMQSRIANDIGGMGSVITTLSGSIVGNITTVVSSLIAMLALDWQLTIVSLLMVPVFALISRNVGNQRRTITRERQKQMAVLSVMVEETLSVSGFLLGRVMGRTPTLIEQFAQQSGRLTELTVKSAMTGRCLISAALSFLLARQPFAGWIASAGGPGATRLVQNLFVLSMAYWLMCFYLYSAAADAADGNRRARREALFLALAAIGLISATVAAGSHDHGANFQASDLRDRALGSFYLVADVYLAYALAMALRWTCAYARASQRPLATGLWLAAVGIGAMAASCTIRTVLTVVRWQGSTVPPAVTWASGLIIAMAVPLFLIGVSYPGVATRLAAMRVRRQHRRMYHRLGPLWQMLHEAYPEHSLYRVPAKAWRDHLLPLGMHRRYYRRVIECRDGLVRISPQLAPTIGLVEEQPEWADDLADQLYTALHSEQPQAAPADAVPVAMPLTQSLEDDVRQLAQLSDAVRRRVLAGTEHTD